MSGEKRLLAHITRAGMSESRGLVVDGRVGVYVATEGMAEHVVFPLGCDESLDDVSWAEAERRVADAPDYTR